MCTTRQFTDKQKRAQIRIVKNLIKKADLSNKSELQDFCYNLSYMNYMVRKGYCKTKFNADYEIYDWKAVAMQKLIDECRQNCSYCDGILYVYVNNRQYSYHDYNYQMKNTDGIRKECKWDGIKEGFLLSDAEYRERKHRQESYIPKNWLSYYDNLREIVQYFANSACSKLVNCGYVKRELDAECLRESEMRSNLKEDRFLGKNKIRIFDHFDNHTQSYIDKDKVLDVPTWTPRLVELLISWAHREHKKMTDADTMLRTFPWLQDYIEYKIRSAAEDILVEQLEPMLEAELKQKRTAFLAEFFDRCQTLPKRSRESWAVVTRNFSECWWKYREKLGYEQLPDNVRRYFINECIYSDDVKKDPRYFIPSDYARDYYWDKLISLPLDRNYKGLIENKADKVFASYIKQESKKRVKELRNTHNKAV